MIVYQCQCLSLSVVVQFGSSGDPAKNFSEAATTHLVYLVDFTSLPSRSEYDLNRLPPHRCRVRDTIVTDVVTGGRHVLGHLAGQRLPNTQQIVFPVCFKFDASRTRAFAATRSRHQLTT